jgi:hypothetical protein
MFRNIPGSYSSIFHHAVSGNRFRDLHKFWKQKVMAARKKYSIKVKRNIEVKTPTT